jgi:hypothetical protein
MLNQESSNIKVLGPFLYKLIILINTDLDLTHKKQPRWERNTIHKKSR